MKKKLLIIFIFILIPFKTLGTALSPTSSVVWTAGTTEPTMSCSCTNCSCTVSKTMDTESGEWSVTATLTSASVCSGTMDLYVNGSKVTSVSTRTEWSGGDGASHNVSPSDANKNSRGDANYYFQSCNATNTVCTNLHTRCGASGPSPPDACWRKEWVDDDNVEHYDYYWGQDPGNGYSETNLNKTMCDLSPAYCENGVVSKKNTTDKSCVNSLTTKKLKSGFNCKQSSTAFYNITCEEKYDATYTPALRSADGKTLTTIKLKAGQGFSYTISLKDTDDCTGTFDFNKWKSVYDNAKKLYERAVKVNDASEKAWFKNKIKDVIGYIKTYNDWEPVKEATVTGSMNIKYKEIGDSKPRDHKESFDVVYELKTDEKKDKESKCQNLSYVDVDTGKSKTKKVCPFTWKIVGKYSLTPKHVYVNRETWQVAKSNSTATIDGGKNFYISLDAVPGKGTFDTKIVAKKTDGNTYTINNTDCSLEIVEDENVYRIINDKNAFVNDTRQIGQNWKNPLMDFTNIVGKSNLVAKGNQDYLYKFNLSKDEITALKNYNSQKKNVYSRTCGSKNLTGAIKKICDIIG